jgi:biopolymer transport protein ExbB/TolQ
MDENPHRAPREERQPAGFIWKVSYFLGIVLALAPIFAGLPTVVRMVSDFNQIAATGQPPPLDREEIAESVLLDLRLTAGGLLVCPVGIAIVIVARIRLRKTKGARSMRSFRLS